jgi:hypothetical protein
MEIATAFSNLMPLKTLDLEDNNIGEGGATALVTTLSKLPMLESLTLIGNNHISEPTKKAIRDKMRTGTVLF